MKLIRNLQKRFDKKEKKNLELSSTFLNQFLKNILLKIMKITIMIMIVSNLRKPVDTDHTRQCNRKSATKVLDRPIRLFRERLTEATDRASLITHLQMAPEKEKMKTTTKKKKKRNKSEGNENTKKKKRNNNDTK